MNFTALGGPFTNRMNSRTSRLALIDFKLNSETEEFLFCQRCDKIHYRASEFSGQLICPSCSGILESCRGMEIENARAEASVEKEVEAEPTDDPEIAQWQCGSCEKTVTGLWEDAGEPCEECKVEWNCPTCEVRMSGYKSHRGRHCEACTKEAIEISGDQFDLAIMSNENAAEASRELWEKFNQRELDANADSD